MSTPFSGAKLPSRAVEISRALSRCVAYNEASVIGQSELLSLALSIRSQAISDMAKLAEDILCSKGADTNDK